MLFKKQKTGSSTQTRPRPAVGVRIICGTETREAQAPEYAKSEIFLLSPLADVTALNPARTKTVAGRRYKSGIQAKGGVGFRLTNILTMVRGRNHA